MASSSSPSHRLLLPPLLLLLLLGCNTWTAAAFLLRPPPPLAAARACCGLSARLMMAASSSNDEGSVLPGLVSPAWLQAHLEDPDLAVLDIRGEVAKSAIQPDGSQATQYVALQSDYVDGHIPGAVFVDWTREIAETDENGVPAQLLEPVDRLRTLFEEKGVGLRKRVVVYDSGTHLFATRLWWALRLAGHGAVAVLDGGWARWLAEDRPITADAPCPLKINEPWECSGDDAPATSVLDPSEQQRPFLSSRVDADFVLHTCVKPLLAARKASEGSGDASTSAAAGAAGAAPPPIQIIDARTAEQFSGAVSRSQRAGHIPGAVNVPYKTLLSPAVVDPTTGLSYRRMQRPAELEATLKAAGVWVDKGGEGAGQGVTTCVYCNGGVASTVVGFVLNQLYGMQWLNYDGSWNEWGKREDLPAEKNQK